MVTGTTIRNMNLNGSAKGDQQVVGGHVDHSRDDLVLVGSNLPHCWRTAPEFNGSSQACLLQFPPDCLGANPETKKIRDLLDQSTGTAFRSFK